MTQDEIKTAIFLLVQEDIDRFPQTPSFSMDYWQGYSRAMEIVHGFSRNVLWTPVKQMGIAYCDKLRNGKPIAGILVVK